MTKGGSLTTEQIVEKLSKIREECRKAGSMMMFNLQLNFFANYSAVVQGLMARVETITKRITELIDRDRESEVPKAAPETKGAAP